MPTDIDTSTPVIVFFSFADASSMARQNNVRVMYIRIILAERPRTSIADKGRVFGLVDGCSCHKAWQKTRGSD